MKRTRIQIFMIFISSIFGMTIFHAVIGKIKELDFDTLAVTTFVFSFSLFMEWLWVDKILKSVKETKKDLEEMKKDIKYGNKT